MSSWGWTKSESNSQRQEDYNAMINEESIPAPRIIARATVARQDGEYVVRAYDQYGKRYYIADYYTDNRLDAYLTRVCMLCPRVWYGPEYYNPCNIQHIIDIIGHARKGEDDAT